MVCSVFITCPFRFRRGCLSRRLSASTGLERSPVQTTLRREGRGGLVRGHCSARIATARTVNTKPNQGALGGATPLLNLGISRFSRRPASNVARIRVWLLLHGGNDTSESLRAVLMPEAQRAVLRLDDISWDKCASGVLARFQKTQPFGRVISSFRVSPPQAKEISMKPPRDALPQIASFEHARRRSITADSQYKGLREVVLQKCE